MVLVQLVVVLNGLLGLSAAAVMVCQSFAAAALTVVEFREKMESAGKRWEREGEELNLRLECRKRQSTKAKTNST